MTRVIKADDNHEPDSPRAAVLNLKDLAAEARQVVLDARQQAARILSEAREKAEVEAGRIASQARQEGFAQGREEGLAAGRAQGLQEAREQFQAVSADLTVLTGRVLRELRQAHEEAQENHCGRMLDFALALAGKIVGQVAVSDIRAAEANLAKALDLAGRAPIVIRANPGQLEALRDYAANWADSLTAGGEIQWAADEKISPGGVKVTAGQGEIDATIESQMAHVVRALLGGQPAPCGEPDDTAGWYVPAGGEGKPAGESESSAIHVSL